MSQNYKDRSLGIDITLNIMGIHRIRAHANRLGNLAFGLHIVLTGKMLQCNRRSYQ